VEERRRRRRRRRERERINMEKFMQFLKNLP
jgi:hypothetical protein